MLDGEVVLHDADGRSVGETRGPGSLLDEMAMFVPTEHFLGAVTIGNGALLELPRHVFGQLMVEQPFLAMHFSQAMEGNLVRMAETLRELDTMLEASAGALDALPHANDISELASPAALTLENGAAYALTPFGPGDASGEQAAPPAAEEPQAGPANGNDNHNGNGDDAGERDGQTSIDLISWLRAATTPSDQTPQERAHDQMAFPSRALRQ